MIGIGIDTGGTCTDIVVYDREEGEVLYSGKTQTTHDNLKIGILRALSGVPENMRKSADYVSLSTTIATNACVENEGGRAGLILIGAHPKVVERNGGEYGLPPLSQMCLISAKPGEPFSPDREKLAEELRAKFSDCDSMAVVQIDPQTDGGALEKQLEQLVGEILGVPCVLGSFLFHELNVLRRGASTLLNARLQSVMQKFLLAIRESLAEMSITAPVWIVRSDGSVMSPEFAAEHPVETLLCGPAASVIGGQFLARADTALIVDMGGTTTDISVVKNHIPASQRDGIRVGSWRTMVKGVYIRTLALGGDTRILLHGDSVLLDQRRCVPICLLASEYPHIMSELKTLETAQDISAPAYEFVELLKREVSSLKYDGTELKIVNALLDGPLSLKELALRIDCSVYALPLKRLENEGVVIRAGMTPTDILHMRGQFCAFNAEASRCAAGWISKKMNLTEEEFCARVEAQVVKRLYCSLASVLLESEKGINGGRSFPQMEKIREEIALSCYYSAVSQSGESFSSLRLRTGAAIVGVGAPAGFFVPQAAKLLGAEQIIPEYGMTANALGAAVSSITARAKLVIRPVMGDPSTEAGWVEESAFQITGEGIVPVFCKSMEEAEERGRAMLEEILRKRVKERGAEGAVRIGIGKTKNEVPAYGSAMLLSVDLEGVGAGDFI